MGQGEDDPIVVLATVPNEPEAELWLQILREAGIRAMAKPLGPGFGAWASVATLDHAIYVLRSQLEQAREVMRGVEGIGFEGE